PPPRVEEKAVKLRYLLQSAEADIVCVDAVSNRRLIFATTPKTPNHDKINPTLFTTPQQWKKAAPKPT
ncbi:hypothetical protein, partial [Microcoleus sp. PH2017_18_LLB_O_A]|uniref:hypothetical protein n=1 Tax=Microcoleus sp. PH2017_18_LLB_O_A TaxID=2798829 RepID=UPI0025D8B910